jgi:hypothetical protein
VVYFKDGTSKIVWGLDKPQLYEKYPQAKSIFEMNRSK